MVTITEEESSNSDTSVTAIDGDQKMHQEDTTAFNQFDDDSHLLHSTPVQQATQKNPQPNPLLSDVFNSPTQEPNLSLNNSFILFESPVNHQSITKVCSISDPKAAAISPNSTISLNNQQSNALNSTSPEITDPLVGLTADNTLPGIQIIAS